MQQSPLAYHGNTNSVQQIDGIRFNNMEGAGQTRYIVNAASVQEMTVETGGTSAESQAAGLLMNVIPKEGGNRFVSTISALFSNESLNSDNLKLYARKVAETRISAESETIPAAALSIIEAPVAERESNARRAGIVALAGALGLMLSVGIALVSESSNMTLRLPEDVEHHLGLPVLATLPDRSRMQAGIGREPWRVPHDGNGGGPR